jgi:hypothetical protein
VERCAPRSGNVRSAASWREVREPVVARYRGTAVSAAMRLSPNTEIYEFLEAKGMGFAIRLPANRVLANRAVQDKIDYLLKRRYSR